MLAASRGRLDLVQLLTENGADMNIQDEDGSSALMYAAEHGHALTVKYLLSQPNCDASITDYVCSSIQTSCIYFNRRNFVCQTFNQMQSYKNFSS
jgi:ankyrin repeat protein